MQVKDVMSKRRIVVAPDDNLAIAAQKMRDYDIGCLLVEHQSHLCGIVTDRDIACRGFVPGREATELDVRDVMTRHVICCHADDLIDQAVLTMEKHKVRRLAVTDKDNQPVGVLSLGDIALHMPPVQCGELVAAVSKPLALPPTAASLR